MKLGYQQATISFCVDLTAPGSDNIPVANLLVGEFDGRQVAGVSVLVPDHFDPLTKAVLNDTLHLLRQYVDEAFQQRSPAAPLRDVLTRVYHSLRNSMHVSTISELAEVDVPEIGQLGASIYMLLHQGLVRSLADAGLVVVDNRPRQAHRPSKPMWASASSLELPQSLVWEPPLPDSGMAAAAG